MSEITQLAAIPAERTILGAILRENEAFYEAVQELRHDEFLPRLASTHLCMHLSSDASRIVCGHNDGARRVESNG